MKNHPVALLIMTILIRPRLAAAFVQQNAPSYASTRPLRSSSSSHSRIRMVTSASAYNLSATEDSDGRTEEKELLHPDDFGPIPYPKHLSPSSAMTFKECPQSFLFQYLYKIRQPTNQILAKGSMCHSALEHIFDLDPDERTLENLGNLLRVEWAENRLEDEYSFLFEKETEMGSIQRDIEAEREWGQSALQLLENYYQSEDPRTIRRPNPHKREVWVNAKLTVDPNLGVTSRKNSVTTTATTTEPETFKVRGIIDRIDIVRESSRKIALKVIDYKTGKAPNLKYSPAMNQKIFQEKFYQLKIYALLMREKNEAAANKKEDTMDLRYLKLHFLNSDEGRAKPWEMDLGATQEIRDEELQSVHRDLSQIWTDIRALVDTQDPTAFLPCNRSFCFCHECRGRFYPGTVSERLLSD